MSSTLANHPPAVKVGGRRLSVSSKPKHVPTIHSPETDTIEPVDYPRPAAPSDRETFNEEESSKDKKKHNYQDAEDKKRRTDTSHANWKAEETQPTRDPDIQRKNVNQTAGVRIAQPANKGTK